jgi:hypothetical protein
MVTVGVSCRGMSAGTVLRHRKCVTYMLLSLRGVTHGVSCRVKESWGWLQASGLPVHITCVNSYLAALIKEVSCSLKNRGSAYTHLGF